MNWIRIRLTSVTREEFSEFFEIQAADAEGGELCLPKKNYLTELIGLMKESDMGMIYRERPGGNLCAPEQLLKLVPPSSWYAERLTNPVDYFETTFDGESAIELRDIFAKEEYSILDSPMALSACFPNAKVIFDRGHYWDPGDSFARFVVKDRKFIDQRTMRREDPLD